MATPSWDDLPDDVKNQLLQQISSGSSGSPSDSSSGPAAPNKTSSVLDPGGFSAGGGSGGAPSAAKPTSTTSQATSAQPNPSLYSSDPRIQDILTQIINGQVPDYAAYDALSQFDQPQNPSYAGVTPRPANAVAATEPIVQKLYAEGAANYGINPDTGMPSAQADQVAFPDESPTLGGHWEGQSEAGTYVPGGPNPNYRAVTPQQQSELDDLARTYPSQLTGGSAFENFLDAAKLFGPVLAGPILGAAGEAAGAGADAASAGAEAGDSAANAFAGADYAAGEAPGALSASDAAFSTADFGAGEAGDAALAGAPSAAGLNAADLAAGAGEAAGTAAPDLSGFKGVAGGPFDSMSGTAFTPDAAPATAAGSSTTDPIAALQSSTGSGSDVFEPDFTETAAGTPGIDTSSLSPDSLAELNSANPAATATEQNAATTALGNSATQAPQGVFDSVKIPSWASTAAKLVPAATTAAGLVKQLTQGKSSAEKQIEQSAANATSIGNQLLSQGQAGTLSPGMQANVDQLKEQMKAQVRGQFANMGLSGSTMEADALNSVDTKISGIIQQYSQNLMQTGQSILQTGTTEFQSIAEAELAADQALQQAIGNFAGSVGISMGLNGGKKAA